VVSPRHKGSPKEFERHMTVIAVCRKMRRSGTMPWKLVRTEVQMERPAHIG
jgi:hypothetical protein